MQLTFFNTSKQISIYHSNLLDIIRIRDEKNNLYKNYLSKAEKFKEQIKIISVDDLLKTRKTFYSKNQWISNQRF